MGQMRDWSEALVLRMVTIITWWEFGILSTFERKRV